MSDYSKAEKDLLKKKVCPDCQMYNLFLENGTYYCEGSGGLDGGCQYFIRKERLKEVISKP